MNGLSVPSAFFATDEIAFGVLDGRAFRIDLQGDVDRIAVGIEGPASGALRVIHAIADRHDREHEEGGDLNHVDGRVDRRAAR